MPIAKVFQCGNSQAVRLPKAFRFSTDKVAIFRRGDEIVLREGNPSLADILDPLPAWPDDIAAEVIPDLSVQVPIFVGAHPVRDALRLPDFCRSAFMRDALRCGVRAKASRTRCAPTISVAA